MGAASKVRSDIAFAVVDLLVVASAYFLALSYKMLDPFMLGRSLYFRDLALALPVIALVHLIYNNLAGAYGYPSEEAGTGKARWVAVTRVTAANIFSIVTLLALNYLARSWGISIILPFFVILLGGLLSLCGMGLVRLRSRPFSLTGMDV
jgi:hypothetical protein